jgi:hypothetical protein
MTSAEWMVSFTDCSWIRQPCATMVWYQTIRGERMLMTFALRIGNRATLIRSPGARAYGMLIALTHTELEHLYGAAGLEQYQPEAVLATRMEGGCVPALCYNLPLEPRAEARDLQYAVRLQQTLRDLGFPAGTRTR